MVQLAWVSPLPPIRSGIADYSAELLPALAHRAAVTAFAPPPWQESGLLLPVYPLEHLPDALNEALLPIYHLGNNPHHVGIYELALRFPGIVVLHDYVLHNLVARCTIHVGDFEGYRWHMEVERGRSGVAAAVRRYHGVFSNREQFLDPLNRVVLERARAVIVHNRWAEQRVRHDHPGLPVHTVLHHLSPVCLPDREEVRRRLGIDSDQVVLASFGFIAPHKRIPSLLQAYASLRRQHPGVRCFLVGEPDPAMDMARLLERLGLSGQVVVTGYVDAAHFWEYVAACDIAINLRHPSAGETSGTLIRLLGNGKAAIVSNVGQFASWPDDVCLKVDVGPAEEAMLLYYLQRLVDDVALRQQLGENARRYIRTHHALEQSAAAYLAVVQQVLAGVG